MSNVCSNVFLDMKILLSNVPSGPSDADPLVTVCAAASLFVHVTVPPTLTVTVSGTKHSLVVSHPGLEAPTAIATSAADGADDISSGVSTGSGSGSGGVTGVSTGAGVGSGSGTGVSTGAGAGVGAGVGAGTGAGIETCGVALIDAKPMAIATNTIVMPTATAMPNLSAAVMSLVTDLG